MFAYLKSTISFFISIIYLLKPQLLSYQTQRNSFSHYIMDLVERCKKFIEEKRQEIENIKEDDNPDSNDIPMFAQMESQSYSEGYFTDQDKNLNKILDQQTHLKRIIDQDNNIQMFKNLIAKTSLEIEDLRKNCTKSNEEALRKKQELAHDQAKEVGPALGVTIS